MKIDKTELKDSYEITIDRYGDERGFFEEYFNVSRYESLGFKPVCQTNRSKSSKGVFRGLHFQKNPYCQAKIVEVIKGSALDIIADIRKDSPTYGKYIVVHLTHDKHNQLFVPRGFAHGFIALEDDTEFQYLVDNTYNKASEGGIAYNDPDLNIDFAGIMKQYGIEELILSDKDKLHPTLKECDYEFYDGEIPETKKKYLITGYNGQLGYDLKRELLKRGVSETNILAVDLKEMDITKEEEVMRVTNEFKPDVIFHCAAYTNVNRAEDDLDNCYKVNVLGTRNMVNASIAVDAKIIYLSTDYVFDGKKEGLYQVDSTPNPKSVYGLTKYLGELEVARNPKHYITRISWVFGINGNNFIKTMLKLAETKDELCVVDDQIGSPTYTVDLSKTLVDMANKDKYGTYHATNSGFCSWAEFARKIFEINEKDVLIKPVSTEEYAKLYGLKQAERPLNSCLDKSKLITSGFDLLPDWEEATEAYSLELKKK